MLKKMIALTATIAAIVWAADTYTLSLETAAKQGDVTFPTTGSVKYQHDGRVVPIGTIALDSFEIKATDGTGNVSDPAWIFVKISPVNNNAPVIKSDTITCLESGSVTYSPIVTDADN